jgi:hypothetical protein
MTPDPSDMRQMRKAAEEKEKMKEKEKEAKKADKDKKVVAPAATTSITSTPTTGVRGTETGVMAKGMPLPAAGVAGRKGIGGGGERGKAAAAFDSGAWEEAVSAISKAIVKEGSKMAKNEYSKFIEQQRIAVLNCARMGISQGLSLSLPSTIAETRDVFKDPHDEVRTPCRPPLKP